MAAARRTTSAMLASLSAAMPSAAESLCPLASAAKAYQAKRGRISDSHFAQLCGPSAR